MAEKISPEKIDIINRTIYGVLFKSIYPRQVLNFYEHNAYLADMMNLAKTQGIEVRLYPSHDVNKWDAAVRFANKPPFQISTSSQPHEAVAIALAKLAWTF